MGDEIPVQKREGGREKKINSEEEMSSERKV